MRKWVAKSVGPWIAALWTLPMVSGVVPGCSEWLTRTANRSAPQSSLDRTERRTASAPGRQSPDAGAPPRPTVWRVEESCARRWSKGQDAELVAGLSRAAEMCAAGLTPLRGAPFDVSWEPGRPVDVAVHVDGPSACLRVVAVSSADAFEVSIAKGADELARAVSTSRVLAIPPDGLVCVLAPADLRVTVSSVDAPGAVGSRAAAGRAALNVWIARGE